MIHNIFFVLIINKTMTEFTTILYKLIYTILFILVINKTMAETDVPLSVYEGAGFILTHRENIVFGLRIKKPEDIAKDPVIELEYMGGKPDKEDNNDPVKTAVNELTEEAGGKFLDDNFADRLSSVPIFQPFSKKWIRCFTLEINDNEYNKLRGLLINLRSWDEKTTKDMKDLTGRSTPVRKGIADFYIVKKQEFVECVKEFKRLYPNAGLKEAKEFRFQKQVPAVSLTTAEMRFLAIRAFNMIIFAQHMEKFVPENQ